MKRLFSMILCVMLLAALLPGCESSDAQPSTTRYTPLAPDFTVYTAEGRAVSLSSLRGMPVVLNFWASWCPPCKAEMPDFQSAWARWGKDVHFVMVNLTDGQQETLETASAFIASSGFTFPVYYDTEGLAASAYQIRSIPTTVFLYSDGTIFTSRVGVLDSDTLDACLQQILGN